MSPAVRRHPLERILAASALLSVAGMLVTGCRPEPLPTPTASEQATPSATAETPSPTPTPVETNLPREVHITRLQLRSDGLFHVIATNDYTVPAGQPSGIQRSTAPACGVDFHPNP